MALKHGTGRRYSEGCRCDVCWDANKRYSEQYRLTHLEGATHRQAKYRAANKHKIKARSSVLSGLRNGSLVRPNVCEHCGNKTFTEASHTDYDQPLDIEWLCRPCHRVKDSGTHPSP